MNAAPQPPPDANRLNALKQVDTLGTASERLFRRLYRNIARRQETPASALAFNQEEVERRLAEAQMEAEQFKAVLATLPQGIIMQDNEGRIVLINPAARDLLGNIKSFWASELGKLFTDFREVVALESEILPLSTPKQVQVNNRVLGAQLGAVADENGQRLGTIILLSDVTVDVMTERIKDQFVSAISHELRTPMAVIKGVGEVLIASGDENNSNRRLLHTLSRNVDILDRMILELLDVSEMTSEAFVIEHEPVDVQELVFGVIKGMMPEIKRAGLNVRTLVRDVAALHIEGDMARLRWAVGHLLQNAIRYTLPAGFVYLTLQRTPDNHVSIQVTDTGVGISDSDLPRIFERFYRGQPRSADGRLIDPRGLGQGLFIARKVIEAHGGYITVSSQEGQGSSFTIFLPIGHD
jgi:two-component system phosphate regulon sensor histidine kinase PhoR